MDTFHQRTTLAQRGNTQPHRHNVRQVGYRLMVTHESHSPVLYRGDQGHQHDSTVFKTHLTPMSETAKRLTPGAEVTVVFDQGHVSTAVRKRRPEALSCVTSLIPSAHDELLHAAVDQCACLRPTSQDHEEILAAVTTQTRWGTDQKMVIGYRPSFFEAQPQSRRLQIHTADTTLQAMQQALSGAEAAHTGTSRSVAEIRSRVDQRVNPDHLHPLMTYTLSGRRYRTFTFQRDEEK